MHFKRLIGIALFSLVLLVQTVRAQVVYPVQITTTVIPPYSPTLSDYTQANFDRLQSTILLTDLTQPQVTIQLELTLASVDGEVVVQSAPTYEAPTYTIQGGIPLILTGFDMADLLNPDNLVFSGITKEEYLRTLTLPENFYRLQLEAREVGTGQIVSNINSGAATFYVSKGDPPFLNLPIDESVIDATPGNPQFIVFQWQPRHFSPNSTFNTRYVFEMVEVNPPERNPYDAFNTSPVLKSEETTQTTLTFDINDPVLLTNLLPTANVQDGEKTMVGRKYAWRVRVEDISGRDLFNNNGQSEVYTFYYAKSCPEPSFVEIDQPEPQQVKIDYVADIDHDQFELQYREYGSGGSWKLKSTPGETFTVDGLEPNTTYEFRIRAQCSAVWTIPKTIGNVTIAGEEAIVCNAPQRVNTSKTTDGDEITFTLDWESYNGNTGYEVQQKNASDESWTTTTVNNTTHSFTVASADLPVTVRVDATCVDNTVKEGTEITLEAETEGFIGSCGTPQDVNFTAVAGEEDNTAELSWESYPEHTHYTLEYKERYQGEESWISHQLTRPQHIIEDLVHGAVYEYRVIFHCDDETASLMPDYFTIEDPEATPVVSTGTADCFPPTTVLHEVLAPDEAEVVWDRVDGAQEYEIMYRVEGSSAWTIERVSARKLEMLPLQPETTYEYQLSAVCDDQLSLKTELASFTTSEPTTGGGCPKINPIVLDEAGLSRLELSWQGEAQHSGYVVYYKKTTQSVSDWYQIQVEEPNVTITALSAGTTYEVRLKGNCGTNLSGYSDTYTFDTEMPEQVDVSCGNTGNNCDKNASGQTSSLAVGDEFDVADFTIEVKEITNASSPFSGTGIVKTGVDQATLNVDFNNLRLNGIGCMTGGKVYMTGTTIYFVPTEIAEEMNGYLDELDGYITQAETYLDVADEALTQIDGILETVTSPPDLSAYEDWTAEQLYEEGKQLLAEGEAIKDAVMNGDVGDLNEALALIAKGAALIKKAIELGAGAVDLVEDTDDLDALPDYQVVFKAAPGLEASFDAYDGQKFEKFYQRIGTADEEFFYYVPYIGIDENTTKKVRAEVTISGFSRSKLKFVTNSLLGLELQQVPTSNLNELTFTEVGDNTFEIDVPADAGRIYALYENESGELDKLGKLAVVETPLIQQKVIIVPNVTGVTLNSQLTDQLNTIYDVPNVEFTVQLADYFDYQGWDVSTEGLNVDDHKFMSRFSGEMSDIEREYFRQENITREDGVAYLFVVSKIVKEDGEEIDGYMPRNNEIGFISTTDQKTIAHEIGHGLFKLAHTWELTAAHPEGSTDNLMDYDDEGTKLLGAQWKQIHNPTFDIYGLDNVEEAEGKTWGYKLEAIFSAIESNKTDESYTFINTSSTYYGQGADDSQFTYGSSTYTLKDISLDFSVSIDLSNPVVEFNEDYDRILVRFKNTGSEDYALELEFDHMRDVQAFGNTTNYQSIVTTASDNIKTELDACTESSDDKIINITGLSRKRDLEKVSVSTLCDLVTYIMTASDAYEVGDDGIEEVELILLSSVDNSVSRIEEFFQKLVEKKIGEYPLWYGLLLDFTEYLFADKENSDRFFELINKLWSQSRAGDAAYSAMEGYYTGNASSLSTIKSYPLVFSGAIQPQINQNHRIIYSPSYYSDGTLAMTYDIKSAGSDRSLISSGHPCIQKSNPFTTPVIIMSGYEASNKELGVVPAFYAWSLNRIYNAQITNAFSIAAFRSFIFYVSLVSTLGTSSPTTFSMLINIADLTSASLGMVSMSLEQQLDYGNLSASEIEEYRSYLASTEKIIAVFDMATLGKLGFDGLSSISKVDFNALNKIVDALNSGKLSIKSGFGNLSASQIRQKLNTLRDKLLDVFRNVDGGEVINVFYKNVDEFAETFDKAGEVSQTIRNRAFELYKEGNWGELETLFRNNNINGKWPPANGGFNIEKVFLKKDEILDRYQYRVEYDDFGNIEYTGGYVSPKNSIDEFYDYSSRALKGAEDEYDLYYQIIVKKDFDFEVELADIIPWWGHKGLGKQIAFPENRGVSWLLENDYIDVTPIRSPKGNVTIE